MKRILLLRHGSTEANERFLYCGRSDLCLTDKGKNYLRSRALSYQKKLNTDEKENSVNVKYFTSGMKRTDETLEILFDTRSYERLMDFKEMDFGIYEMKSYDELKDRPDYREWISGDFYSNIPVGGESGNQMKKRVLTAFDKLTAKLRDEPEDAVYVLVCHGGVIAAIMEYLFVNEGRNLYEWQPKPGCGYLLFMDEAEKSDAGFSRFTEFS